MPKKPTTHNLLTTGGRVRFARTNKRVSLQELGKYLGMSPQGVWYLEEKGSPLCEERIKKISKALNICPHFLRTGEGQPYDGEKYIDPRYFFKLN